MCSCLQIFVCGENGFRQSILRTHPSCLLQDWIGFPKSNDSPGDLHSCECQSHRMRNRISCCSFIIEASICTYKMGTAKVSLVILASLFIQILIVCSDWLNIFPSFSVGVIDCYWWYPLRPELISVSLSVSLIPAVYDGPVVTNISCGTRCDVRFAVFMCFLALSVFDALFIAACELSVELVLTLVWMRFWASLEVMEQLIICITVIHEPLILTNQSCYHVLMKIIFCRLYLRETRADNKDTFFISRLLTCYTQF